MSQKTLLALDGLTCGHCVKRVKETLENARMLNWRKSALMPRAFPATSVPIS